MTETSTQLARRADKARERLVDRLEDLRYHASPLTVVSDLFDVNPKKMGADSAAQVVVQQIKSNPIAFLLIAAGFGWLILSGSPNSPQKKARRIRRKQHTKNTASRRTAHPHR